MTIRASETDKKLAISPNDDGLNVENQFGVTVSHLAVQDDQGRLFWCTDLLSGERRKLTEMDRVDVLSALRDVLQDNEPEFPPGAEDVRGGRGFYGYELSRGLMEAHLRALASPVLRELGTRVYVAITAQGVELEMGLDDVVDEAGFHLIRGRW